MKNQALSGLLPDLLPYRIPIFANSKAKVVVLLLPQKAWVANHKHHMIHRSLQGKSVCHTFENEPNRHVHVLHFLQRFLCHSLQLQ